MRAAPIFLALLLAACAPRQALVQLPPGAEPGIVHEVFVASTRAAAPDGSLGRERSSDLDYRRIDVSVPEDRETGEISTPHRRDPDPLKDYLVSGRAVYDNDAAFTNALRQRLRALPPLEQEAVIFVHGFNNVVADGVLRTAQLNADIGLPGIEVHFAWPSAASPFGYVFDRESTLFSRDGLETLLASIDAANPRRTILVAHSLGSSLVMETLRQMEIARPGSAARTVDGVILISPDLDVDVFRRQASRIEKLPEPFIIFTSQRDRALRLSSRVSGQTERLGNLLSPEPIADLNVTLLDVSAFSSGTGHFTPADSPALIAILSDVSSVANALGNEGRGQVGLLPGTAISVQNATQVVLSPIAAQ